MIEIDIKRETRTKRKSEQNDVLTIKYDTQWRDTFVRRGYNQAAAIPSYNTTFNVNYESSQRHLQILWSAPIRAPLKGRLNFPMLRAARWKPCLALLHLTSVGEVRLFSLPSSM